MHSMRIFKRGYFSGSSCLGAVVALLLLISLDPCNASADLGHAKNVLLIHSYHTSHPFTVKEVRGIEETLLPLMPEVELREEYLDTKRISSPEYFEKMRDLILTKYAGLVFDVVIVADNDALNFAIKYRSSLFPGIPIVFCGINDFHRKMLADEKNVTGVVEEVDYGKDIQLILNILPESTEVVIISDSTTTGLSHFNALKNVLPKFNGKISFKVLNLSEMTMEELCALLGHLDGKSPVLLLSHVSDKTGRKFSHKDSMRLIVTHSKAPIFVINDIRLGYGTVGGKVVSGYEQGRVAAKMAFQILQGMSPDKIPILERSPNICMYDFVQLRRWNIPQSLLPPGSQIINEPTTPWKTYRKEILIIMFIGCCLVGFIFVLLRSMHTQRRIEMIVRKLNDELEVRVRERTAELQIMNDELEAFSYSIAHDLSAPLRSINSFAAIISEEHEKSLTPDGVKALERIRAASKRMGQLLDDLLRLSKLTRAQMNIERVDLGVIALEIVARLKERAPERDVEITIAPNMNVTADKGLMQIALENLFSNAWKYTSDRHDAKIKFFMTHHGEKIVYEIEDNGIGFDMRYADKLFNLFSRLEVAERFPGTGVGLSIVQRIIRRHGGQIWAQSEEGSGATFSFTLPEAPPGGLGEKRPYGA